MLRAFVVSLAVVLSAGFSQAQELVGAATELRDVLRELTHADSQDQFDQALHAIPSVLGRVGLGDEEKTGICVALGELTTQELFLIETDLHHPLHAENVKGCFESMIQKLERYRSLKKIDARGANQGVSIPKLRFKTVVIPDSPDIYRYMNLGPKEVTLSFDDGPSPKTTPAILDILDQAGVKAVFFNTGYNASAFSAMSREVISRGHRLGSHSYFHSFDMGCKVRKGRMSQNYALNEVAKGHAAVLAAAGEADPFYRWPNGSSTSVLKKNAMEMGLSVWDWAVDTEDWNTHVGANGLTRAQLILDIFRKGMHHPQVDMARWDRGIVLFHDIWQQTVEALPLVLDYLARNDFTIVMPVSQVRANVKAKFEVPLFFAPIVDLLRKDYRSTTNIFSLFPQLTQDPEGQPIQTTWSEPSDSCASLVQNVKIEIGADSRANGSVLAAQAPNGGAWTNVVLYTPKNKTRSVAVKPGFKISIRGGDQWNDVLASCENLSRRNGRAAVQIGFDLALDDQDLFLDGARTMIVPAARIKSLSCK